MQSDGQGAAGGRTPPLPMVGQNLVGGPFDTGTRRRLFAGFRPLSGFARGRFRSNSTQHRSISLPESNYPPIMTKAHASASRRNLSLPYRNKLIILYTYIQVTHITASLLKGDNSEKLNVRLEGLLC